MANGFDVHSEADLARSLAAWKRDLASRQKQLSATQKAVESAAKGAQRARAMVARRERQLAKATMAGPRRRAVDTALSFVGTTERPAGSNCGQLINLWQGRFHMSAQPWCGAFVGAMIEMAGGSITDRIVYTPYIYADANTHSNGMDGIAWRRGPGWQLGNRVGHSADLVLFDFGTAGIKHVGMLVQPWNGKGQLQTVEGNTSFGPGGSQDNGGAVARRSRDASLVHSIVKVMWPTP